MNEYTENQSLGENQAEVFKSIGIPLGRSYGNSLRKYTNIESGNYEFVFFWFCHKKGKSDKNSFYNHLDKDMIVMEKRDKTISNPPHWKDFNPRIVFYDDNVEMGDIPAYKFKGIYMFSHSEADDSKVYLKKIGSKLLVDAKTKRVSWR